MPKKMSILCSLILLLCTLATSVYAQNAPAAPAQEEQNLVEAARAMRATGKVQFNFKDLEIAQFIRFMSELLGESIVVDPTVKGTVTIVSPRAISFKEARQAMLSVFEMNGLSFQEMSGYAKVVPAVKGPSTKNQVIKGTQSVAPGEQLAVQVVPLDYVKAAYVIEPVKAGVAGIIALPLASGRGVILSGKTSQLSQGTSIIRALDAPDGIRAIKVIPLKYTSPKLVEGHLNAIAKDANSKLSDLLAIGDDRSNKIVLVGGRQSIRESERILVELDVPAKVGNFHVYKLNNADAKVVSEQLSQILAVAARLAPDAKVSSVVPDLPTNSLIFTASQEQYLALAAILKELDTQPKQVLIRGLIAEVNLTKLNSAGIDWSLWGGDAGSNVLAGGIAELGKSGVPPTFMQWFKDMTTKESTTTDANGNAVTTTNTQGMGLIYAYIKMLNSFNAINVLSMPRLMCTDNLQGTLQVGQVIPQLKGKTSDISNPNAVQNTYDYKDTGLILKVTPHIRSGNLVALEIEQSTEDLMSTPGDPTPVTSKRLIKTSVLVANGETIILGGLIKEVERTLKNRVPGLSYIPLLGNLFTSQEKQREKLDLMVFLTPYIVESPKQASDLALSVTHGDQSLSISEKKKIVEYHKEYETSGKKEGIPRETLTANQISSDDIKPLSGDEVKQK